MPTASTLNIALHNQWPGNNVYAYIIGQAIDNNNALFLLRSDGKTPYYPSSPSSTGTALAQDIAIPLGAQGNTVTATIPHLAGARIYFSVDARLTFLLNPGPGLVEPSPTNNSDPNHAIQWDFCEFTFNTTELFVNITYVDFFTLPIALTVRDTSGATTHVSGAPHGARDTICNALTAQTAADGQGWSSLIVRHPTQGYNLRALSPNNGILLNPNLFANYYEPYVAAVWAKYGSTQLAVNTQASFGTLDATVQNNLLTFPNGVTFSRPSTRDVFSCSTGPFAVTGSEQGVLVPRLAAAFNRSTLLSQPNQPAASGYYQTSPTNHYARIIHQTELDGRGYAFPYDDVLANGEADQSGSLASGSPSLLQVTVGGLGASAGGYGIA